VFAIQDEIAAAVVDALKYSLFEDELKATETDPEAYALYLQARHLSRSGRLDAQLQAETLLQQALAVDPSFAPAWVELSHVYRIQVVVHALRPAAEGFELARDAVRQALSADSSFGPAYTALAQIEGQYDWDFDAAAQHMEKALNPDASKVRFQHGQVLLAQGDLTGALIEMKREPNAVYRLSGIAIAQHLLGDTEASNAALQELIASRTETAAYQIAEVYAFRGEISTAFEWLERAYENRDSGLPKMLPDPLLANLRNDPRWVPFLDKMRLLNYRGPLMAGTSRPGGKVVDDCCLPKADIHISDIIPPLRTRTLVRRRSDDISRPNSCGQYVVPFAVEGTWRREPISV